MQPILEFFLGQGTNSHRRPSALWIALTYVELKTASFGILPIGLSPCEDTETSPVLFWKNSFQISGGSTVLLI